MKTVYRMSSFGFSGTAPSGDIAALHLQLLPRSPLSQLGRHFLDRYYYTLLPQQGLIFGAIAYVDGRPAGFISATADSRGVMKTALRRHFLAWAWGLGSTVLARPARFAALWELWQIMRCRTQTPDAGEILSLGVLPQYRDSAFLKQGGPRIASDLLDFAMEEFRARGIRTIRAIADSDNLIAHRFYMNHGGMLESRQVGGWRVPSVEFIWRTGLPEAA